MRRIAFAALLAAVVLAAPARGDVYDDNPAAASRGPGDIYLFARGADGATLERHWTGTAWSDWASLGGNATSGPAAAAYGNAINVFVRGTDGAIYQNTLSAGVWSGWSSLGGYASSGPAVSWRRGSLNYFDIAIKGGDNAIWFETWVPGTGWSGWSSLGGNLTSGPTLNSQSDGLVNIFARGTDGAVAQRSWDGTKWVDWLSLGGGIIGAPSALSRAPGALNLYARGLADATYSRSWSSGGWTGWSLLDSTPLDSTPVPFSDDPSREAVVAKRGDHLLLKSWLASSGWGPWTDLGTIAVPPPAPLPQQPLDGELNLEAGLRCTPAGGKLRISIKVRKRPGQAKARVQRIVFYTKGKGRKVRVDHRAPFVVRIGINRPAGTTGRVYARVYYRRSKHGKLHRKTVSRRYAVCR
jgi:hypothetical protein